MPLPKGLARFNRVVTNRVLGPFAARLPGFAIVTHIPGPEIGTNYFQETQPEQIFADCTRYVGYITSPAQMPRLAELAVEAAILERGVGMVTRTVLQDVEILAFGSDVQPTST